MLLPQRPLIGPKRQAINASLRIKERQLTARMGSLNASTISDRASIAVRTADFWARVIQIYGSYKVTQLRAAALRLTGKPPEELKDTLWHHQHEWAGAKMFELCVSLRGFYLKVSA